MILLILLGLLPSLVWMSFFLQEDIHPEPRRMIFIAFFAGIAGAFFALAAQQIFENYANSYGLLKNSFLSISGYAGIEELFKFLAAYIVVSRSKYFDEPIDAMIYIMSAAMGLAAVENVALMTSGQTVMLDKIGLILFRFLGATLLHALSSSMVGYYWAKGILRKKVLFYVLVGLVGGTLLHAFFNYLIIQYNGKIIYTLALLIFSSFFIFYDFEKLQKDANMNV